MKLNRKNENKINNYSKEKMKQQHNSDNHLDSQIDKHNANHNYKNNNNASLRSPFVIQHLLSRGRKIQMKRNHQETKLEEQHQFQGQLEPAYLEVMVLMNTDKLWLIQSVQMPIAQILTILGTTLIFNHQSLERLFQIKIIRITNKKR